MGEHLVAVFGDHAEIFQAHAEVTRQVDAGFHCDDVAGRERRAVARRKQRLLVDVDADAMPQAVAHLARETMLGKHMLGKFVRFLARHPRTKHGLHLLVRIANGSVSRAKSL